MSRWLAAALLALAPTLAWPAVVSTAPSLNGDLQALLTQEGLAGAVWATVGPEGTQLGATGHAHVPSATPMRVDARMQLGSVAKTVLSLAVLRLVTQGRVQLDDPVATLLPAVAVDNPWSATHPLRLRHLLDHTGGLDDMRLWHLLNRQHQARMPLAEGLASHPDLLRLRLPPGTRMSYSNIGYLLAGMVIEAVTGERYEAWVQRELLLPLQMLDSDFEYQLQALPGADPRLAWGHLDERHPQATMATAARPAGQFTSTADDMARLARFLMSDGRLDGQPFVQESQLRGMGRAQGTDAARAGLATGYALGLAMRDRHGAVGLCHEGSVAGFRAMLCLFAASERAFFIAINSDNEAARVSLLYERLVQALGVALPAAAPAAAASLASPVAEAWNGRYVRAPSRMQTYALVDVLFDSRVWAASGDTALWQRGASSVRLQIADAAQPMLWRQLDRVQASHVLLRDANGTPMISDGLSSFRRWSALQWWALCASAALAAAGALWWLLLPPLRRLRQQRMGRESALAQPAWWALLALPLAAGAVAAQGWQAGGEFTPASAALWTATAALPAAMAWQAWRSARAAGRAHALDVAAALAVLQGCALFGAWGLLPLALWR